MAQTTVKPSNELETKLLMFAWTTSAKEYGAFIHALSDIQTFGKCSMIPFTNLAHLAELGYFEADDRRQWANTCANFLEAIA